MTEEKFDLVAEKYAAFKRERAGDIFEEAHSKQVAGEFTLVKEVQTKPFEGIHFHVDKGQSFRLELVEGTQILDIILLNRDNPAQEYQSQFHTAAMQGLVPHEGYIFISGPPYFRGMATLIRDTVDYERLNTMTPGGQHMFFVNNYRCSESMNEWLSGHPNHNSCSLNFMQAALDVGGEELARAHRHGECFCIFQATAWELWNNRPIMKFFKAQDWFRQGDYVEFIAHQDLTVIVSSCPTGGQLQTEDLLANVNWPVAVKIFDTGIEIPELERSKSTAAIDYAMQGRPGMTVMGAIGTPGGEGSFAWEEQQRRR